MLNHLFSPIKIGKMEIPNRLVVPAMVMNFCTPDGMATEIYGAYHEAKARGGWGLIITEDYAVGPGGKGFPNIPGLWDDSQTKSHREFTDRVHRAGESRIFAQIYHAGRQTSRLVTGVQPVAPSPIPCPLLQEVPHELDVKEIHAIVEQFGNCALRAVQAGFDGIEIHGAHGYLIAQFMSPYSNKRTDGFGGGLINRMRFPLQILSNIRSKVGKDFPVIFRISGDELVPGGRNIEDTKAIAMLLEEAGIDAIHVSVGVYGSQGIVAPAAMGHGWITDLAEDVKKVVRIPVITVGRINDPIVAESVLRSGKADLVAMGRASLADPELPNKAKAGQFEDINRCLACMQGCIGRIMAGRPATCLVNPTLGREEELRIRPAEIKKKVFVAGAGPAGMEAAMVAAKRGHEVHVFERRAEPGGQFRWASVPPCKGQIAGFIAWQEKQLRDQQVALHVNTKLTEGMVEKEQPDAVVIATGSKPLLPDISGIQGKNVVTAQDVLEGQLPVGNRVGIIGGGMIGSEVACHLANHGKEVTVVEMLPSIATDEPPAIRHFILKDLAERRARILVNATVQEVSRDGLVIRQDGIENKVGPFDTIVLAAGLTPVNDLEKELAGKVKLIVTVGDASRVRKAIDAIAEGYAAGLEI